jgi:hypothetical protein
MSCCDRSRVDVDPMLARRCLVVAVERGSSTDLRVSSISWRNTPAVRGTRVGLGARAHPKPGCMGGLAAGCPWGVSWARQLVV